ncbi:Oligopeptide transporter OPT superfamily [Cordyceps fumosorosea ARSEF 2679]|uniref:Oligopeptide transporter OPT superfamily n=1 Tax=Cordyceps fumosorosea (strain ARSEF 2679) TaxID=1081104 RepID=A0A167NKG8_CORFA|nr:Oligopeptide transporter OPT superfamily [Cordyceps fumosorosea ARSEF 2679]OAA55649.1 Oligopeptide transporter OPT superfamily [Cordyceps fumosorosea ARSEF 2679]
MHKHIIAEMKIETALLTNNSPYAEDRAVAIGPLFACIMAFINGFFETCFPAIYVAATLPQLLAYPLGTFLARVLPHGGLTLFGVRHSLNPGPFNRMEHMLISVMSFAYDSAPYRHQIVWNQALPQYFGQEWARSPGYQLCVALPTAFVGYGFAGITPRFIIWPSHCIWPNSRATITLNSALHPANDDGTHPVPGPFGSVWRWSRIRFFLVALRRHVCLVLVPQHHLHRARSNTGLGLNPLPTLDWNTLTTRVDPLYMPSFNTFNYFAGALASMFMIVGVWFSNAYNTAYLPINSNMPFDRFGERYNVTRVLDDGGRLDAAQDDAYSKPYLSAASLAAYFWFFAVYSASITYAALHHRGEIWGGMRAAVHNLFKSDSATREEVQLSDVHEVPDWRYLAVLLASAALGVASMAVWPTGTSPAVVVFGILMCVVFVVPIGIMYAMTSYQMTLNVLAECVSGAVSNGDALSMAYVKPRSMQDLKLGHYVKIPPWTLFYAQMVSTLVSTLVFVGLLQHQLRIPAICTPHAPFRFVCPGENFFFTAVVLWGTVGPSRQFGPASPYATPLIGFPVGVALVLAFWALGRRFPRSRALRGVHPVVLISGAFA